MVTRASTFTPRVQLPPQLVAEESPVPEQEHLRSQVTEQPIDHRLLAATAVLDDQGDFDVGPQLDQAELADLGEGPVAARPGRGAAEGGGVGRRVGDVVDRAVDAHQAKRRIERPRCLGGQRSGDVGEEVPHRGDPQPLPRHAEAGAMGRRFADTKATGMLEDLADGQVGQQSHGEHHPKDDLMGQGAAAGVDPPGVRQRLSDGGGMT